MDSSWVKQGARPWLERYSRVSVMSCQISTPPPPCHQPPPPWLIAADSYHVSPERMPRHLSRPAFVLSRSRAPRLLLRALSIRINDWPFPVKSETEGKGQKCTGTAQWGSERLSKNRGWRPPWYTPLAVAAAFGVLAQAWGFPSHWHCNQSWATDAPMRVPPGLLQSRPCDVFVGVSTPSLLFSSTKVQQTEDLWFASWFTLLFSWDNYLHVVLWVCLCDGVCVIPQWGWCDNDIIIHHCTSVSLSPSQIFFFFYIVNSLCM